MIKRKLNLKWVTDAIGEDYKKWKKGDIIKIIAQTGTGKTYFIKNKLIDNLEGYERLLLVANRINLKRQLKKDLCLKFNKPLPTDIKDLDNVTTIGNVTILSYQQIAEMKHGEAYGKDKLNLDNFDYIICDECHFFLSDGAFNNKCDLAFKALIVERHRTAIKIFISATMEEIDKAIDMSYSKIKTLGFGSYSKRILHEYNTDSDYSYLCIKYFKDIKNIVQLIKNDNTDEKWLIFITKKDIGVYIQEELEGFCSCEMITKDTDINKSDDLKEIIENSKFESKVLICTKAMENGINMNDELLKNIVIMAYDKTTFIQELGRIRIDIENAPQINLYIPTYSWKTFNTLTEKKYKFKFDKIYEYEENVKEFNCKYDRNFDKLDKDIFIKEDCGWKINTIGHARLIKDNTFAVNMKDKFNDEGEFAYIKEQLSWIGLENNFNEDDLIEDTVDKSNLKELEMFLKGSFESREYFYKENFINKITKIIENDRNLRILFNKIAGNGKARAKGIQSFNKLLLDNEVQLPYVICSEKKTINSIRKNYWFVKESKN